MKHYKETVWQVIDKCTCDICGKDTDIPDNGSALQSLSCTIQAATQFSYYGDVDCKDIDIDICYRCIGKVLQSIELKSEKMNEADKFLIEVQDFLNN